MQMRTMTVTTAYEGRTAASVLKACFGVSETYLRRLKTRPGSVLLNGEPVYVVARVKSGDTAVIVNAFLGIGNIPYVRGEGAGLSPDKGAPMDLLEIGKYQWKCGGMIADPIKISVWLNDEIPSNLGELVLNPNETLEIDPSFE